MATKRNIDSGKKDSMGRRIMISGNSLAQDANIDARKESIKNLDVNQKYNQAINGDNHYALAADSDYRIRSAVAEKSDNIHILSELSYDSDWRVRRSVAGNSNAPTELVSDMVEDESNKVRNAVLQNPRCDRYVLSDWSMKGDVSNRMAIASNPSIDYNDLAALSADKDADVRLATVYNPSVSKGMLNELSQDEDQLVRNEAERVHWSKVRDEERMLKK